MLKASFHLLTSVTAALISTPGIAWQHATSVPRSSLRMALKPPPITDTRKLTIGWKEVAKRAAAGCEAAFRDGQRRVSVDIPQISSVDRSTTARKFEDDNNFLLNLIDMLGGGKTPTPVGKPVEIMMGGFEGGGDYLSDEGLYGYRFEIPRLGLVTAIGNSEIDSSALRELPKFEERSGRVLLFNTNLDRLSFFDKMGLPKLDDVETAYVLRQIGPGFLERQYPLDFAVWRIDNKGNKGKLSMAASQKTPFKGQSAQAALK